MAEKKWESRYDLVESEQTLTIHSHFQWRWPPDPQRPNSTDLRPEDWLPEWLVEELFGKPDSDE